MGDNGYFLGERQLAGKWLMYDNSIRVPLIVFDPRIEDHKDIEEMALNIDIPATIIDLAGIDLNVYCPAPKAVVWQPGMETEYLGPARLINEAIISLNSSCRIEGDLPTGLLRATTSEAIIQGMGVERIWPRTFGEVTADQVQRICQLANDSGMAIAGYINRRYLSLIKNQIEFDK